MKVRRWLQSLNPDAASSLDEAIEELLTLHRLEKSHTLCTNLKSTNLIESAFALSAHLRTNVKRWRNPDQALRWAAASLLEAEKSFRKIKGCQKIKTTIMKIKNFDIQARVA